MIAQQMRVAGMIARNEVTTDLPDYRDLYTIFPDDDDWNALRDVGGARSSRSAPPVRKTYYAWTDDPNAGRERAGPHLRNRGGAHYRGRRFNIRGAPASRVRRRGRGGLVGKAPSGAGNELQYFAESVEDWFDTSPTSRRPTAFTTTSTRAKSCRPRSESRVAREGGDAEQRLAAEVPLRVTLFPSAVGAPNRVRDGSRPGRRADRGRRSETRPPGRRRRRSPRRAAPLHGHVGVGAVVAKMAAYDDTSSPAVAKFEICSSSTARPSRRRA